MAKNIWEMLGFTKEEAIELSRLSREFEAEGEPGGSFSEYVEQRRTIEGHHGPSD